MTRAETVAIRRASAADEGGLTRLWAECFDAPLLAPQWLLDGRRHARTVVAERDGAIVGSVYGMPKRLRNGAGGVDDVLGIGSVAVSPSARGLGVSRRMMQATIDGARAEGRDWVLLFTGTPGVYSSLGFTTFTMSRTAVGRIAVADASLPERARREIIPLTGSVVDASLLAELAELAEPLLDGVALAPARGRLDWAAAFCLYTGSTLHLLRSPAGAISAWLVEGLDSDRLLLRDAGRAAGEPAALEMLASAVAEERAQGGARTVSIALPAGAERNRLIAAIAPGATEPEDATGMSLPLALGAAALERSLSAGRAHFADGDYF